MEGEVLVISGPRLCERFPLGVGETHIGRSPHSTIQLDEPVPPLPSRTLLARWRESPQLVEKVQQEGDMLRALLGRLSLLHREPLAVRRQVEVSS